MPRSPEEQLFCGFKIKDFSRIAIDPLLDPSAGGIGALAKIASFRDESAYDAAGRFKFLTYQAKMLRNRIYDSNIFTTQQEPTKLTRLDELIEY